MVKYVIANDKGVMLMFNPFFYARKKVVFLGKTRRVCQADVFTGLRKARKKLRLAKVVNPKEFGDFSIKKIKP